MSRMKTRAVTPEEFALLKAARNYCRVKLCGNERLAHPWRALHRAYGALVRAENAEAGIRSKAKLRRVA